MVREYSGDAEGLGRVEQFFLCLAEIQRLGPRMQALQATMQFEANSASVVEELESVGDACEQVRKSAALKDVLQQVLALGNYLNGSSFRGGAYGFKLADLSKLVQVKSGDNKTTLLHYLAKLVAGSQGQGIDGLKESLSALELAKDIVISEKKAEVGKLSVSFKLVQKECSACDEADPFVALLTAFIKNNENALVEQQEKMATMEKRLKEVAVWLGDKPGASTEDVFGPLHTFVKALEKAHKDNVREEAEARKRAATAAAGGPRGRKTPVGGMGGGPRPDQGMMMEMQLKMAKRAEQAAQASGKTDTNTSAVQQRWLATKMAVGPEGEAEGVGAALAADAASGALYAQRRQSRQMHNTGALASKAPVSMLPTQEE